LFAVVVCLSSSVGVLFTFCGCFRSILSVLIAIN